LLQGFRTLEDLKAKANLTRQQKIGLKHFDDIQDRMPREEVEQIAAVVCRTAINTYRLPYVLDSWLQGLWIPYRKSLVTVGEVLYHLVFQVETAALFVEPKVNVELCGSYRRGKMTCGDVDVLITKPDDTPTDILPCILQQLKESGTAY
jgi:DNA polymerase IV (family X)